MHSKVIGNTEFLFRELLPEQVENGAAKLRFQVFCKERGILPESDYPDERELDHYDTAGEVAHFGLFANGEMSGYARLLMRGERPLPFFRMCPDTRGQLRGMGVRKLAEVSRVMVNKDFRCREGDRPEGIGEPPAAPARPDRRVLPATLGLYREVTEYAVLHGISHFVVLMEPGLDRLLRHFAIRFRQVGEPIDYGGMVYPYLLRVRDMLTDMRREKRSVFLYFLEGLPPAARRQYEG